MPKDPQIFQIRLANWLMRKTTSAAIRRAGETPFTLGTDIGLKRTDNQDRAVLMRMTDLNNQSFTVAILCDGMGGMSKGAECAATAISQFLLSCAVNRTIEIRQRLVIATHEANAKVHEEYAGRGGATLSAVIIDSNEGFAAVNVGDSRIYAQGYKGLFQLTTDDTIAGQFQSKFGFEKPNGNELLQFIGMGLSLEPHIIFADHNAETIYITSDGVHYLEQQVMQQILLTADDPALSVKRLIEVAKWCGGKDNATAIAFSLGQSRNPYPTEANLIQIWDSFGDMQMYADEYWFGDADYKENWRGSNLLNSDYPDYLQGSFLSTQMTEHYLSSEKELAKDARKSKSKNKSKDSNRAAKSTDIETKKLKGPQLKIDLGGGKGKNGRTT